MDPCLDVCVDLNLDLNIIRPLLHFPRLLHPVADGGLPTTINQVCPITVWGGRLQAGGMTF